MGRTARENKSQFPRISNHWMSSSSDDACPLHPSESQSLFRVNQYVSPLPSTRARLCQFLSNLARPAATGSAAPSTGEAHTIIGGANSTLDVLSRIGLTCWLHGKILQIVGGLSARSVR
jgi:hypothetical protein